MTNERRFGSQVPKWDRECVICGCKWLEADEESLCPECESRGHALSNRGTISTANIPEWQRAAMWNDYNRGGVAVDEIAATFCVPAAVVKVIVGEHEPIVMGGGNHAC